MFLFLLQELLDLLLYISNRQTTWLDVSSKVPSLILTRKSQASGPHKNLFCNTQDSNIFEFYIEKSHSDREVLFLSDF